MCKAQLIISGNKTSTYYRGLKRGNKLTKQFRSHIYTQYEKLLRLLLELFMGNDTPKALRMMANKILEEALQQLKRHRTSYDFPRGMIFFSFFCSLFEDTLLTKSSKNNKKIRKIEKEKGFRRRSWVIACGIIYFVVGPPPPNCTFANNS